MPVHHRLRLLAFPMRATGGEPPWPDMRSPGSRTRSVRTCQGLRPRRAGRALAMAHPSVLPSVSGTASAPRMTSISRLNGWPMRSPTDASPTSSRTPAHGSGPMWFATPSSQWTLTTYSLPVSRRTPPLTHSRTRCLGTEFRISEICKGLPIAIFVIVLAILLKFIGLNAHHDDGFVRPRAALNAYVFADGKRGEVDINPGGSVLECWFDRHHRLKGKVIFRINQGFDCDHAILQYSNAMTTVNPIIA